MRESSTEHDSKIILALDVTGPVHTRSDRAEALLDQLGDHVAGVKVNFHLLLPNGLEGVEGVAAVCARKGLPLIADIKLNDIESTNLETVELLFGGGFDAVIANPFAGYAEGLSGVLKKAKALGKGVILLVYMSHAGAVEGYAMRVGREPVYLRFAKKTRQWEADGAIVSAKSPEIIRAVRKVLRPWQLILSPGVGFQGGEAAKAVGAGTDFAIVGRTVIESTNPLKTLEKLNLSLAGR